MPASGVGRPVCALLINLGGNVAPGTNIGRWKVVRVIAENRTAAGNVYEVNDSNKLHQENRALKLYHPNLLELKDIRGLLKVVHDNVIRRIDDGVVDNSELKGPDPHRPVDRPLATAEFGSGTIRESEVHGALGRTDPLPLGLGLVSAGEIPWFPLEGVSEVRIGRDTSCELQLRDRAIFRVHARLRYTPAGWEITDLGSTNRVKVNGALVVSSLLADGDRIQLSKNTVFVLHLCGPRPDISGEGSSTQPSAPQ